MRTDVTSEDIELGRPCLRDCCPVARALSREHGGVWFVDRGRILHEIGEVTVAEYETPAEVAQFIEDFDMDRGEPRPFTFTLAEAV